VNRCPVGGPKGKPGGGSLKEQEKIFGGAKTGSSGTYVVS